MAVVGRGGMSKIKKLKGGGDVPRPPFPARRHLPRRCPAHRPSLSSRHVVAGGVGVGVVVVVVVVVDGVGVVGGVVVIVVVLVVVVMVVAMAVVMVMVGGVAVVVGCGCGCGLMDVIAVFGLFG